MSIDWKDPKCHVTPHFTVHDACWLPSWGKLHYPTPEEQDSLVVMCQLMERVRALLGKPINVHCMIRPAAYNAQIGGALHSRHLAGLACDFDVGGMDCDSVRAALLPNLATWGARMEDKPGSDWVHLDWSPSATNRFFKP